MGLTALIVYLYQCVSLWHISAGVWLLSVACLLLVSFEFEQGYWHLLLFDSFTPDHFAGNLNGRISLFYILFLNFLNSGFLRCTETTRVLPHLGRLSFSHNPHSTPGQQLTWNAAGNL